MKILWETRGILGMIETSIRLVEVDGSFMMEMMLPPNRGFINRFKDAWRYLFHGGQVAVGIVPIEEEDVKSLKETI